MRAMGGRHARSAVSVVTVPMARAVAVAMVPAVVVGVAEILAMAVNGGEVLAEGLEGMCVGHVGLRS
jgi:hypothetical protein